PLTVLFSQSGLGKTSLLQAGLFPRLRREGYLPILLRLDHAADAQDPCTQIRIALAEARQAAGLPGVATPAGEPSLWACFHHRDREWKTAEGRPIRPVLVFDQFEELFTRGQSSDAVRARSATFLTELADLVENR